MTPFWHPFANPLRADRHRVVLVSGEGSTLVDRDGRRYFDATACLWYCAAGHGRQQIAEAIRAQAGRLAACSAFDVYCSDRTLELADRLAAMVPVEDARIFLTSGGSDGVETAAKLARRYFALSGQPQRTTIVTRERSYHGTHGFGTSMAGIAGNREGYGPLVEDTLVVDAFDARALAAAIDARPEGTVAAFFAEPVIGAGGVFPPPDGYLAEAAEVCRARGVLFVADEVITGFGRTGAPFGSVRYGVRPDMMILAKVLTSGYQPLGAVAIDGRIAAPFAAGDGVPFRHGYTYSGHATACAAALANLDLIESEDLMGRARDLGETLPGRLAPLIALDGVSAVRCAGLTAAVQLDGELLAERGISPDDVADACRRRGVLTRVLASGALLLSPPFVVTEEELDRFAAVVGDAVEELTAGRERHADATRATA